MDMPTITPISNGLAGERPVRPLSLGGLRAQNRRYRGSGGVSAGNRGRGFRPAFLDRATGRVYLSRFADGRPAPVHLLDGLPRELVMQWTDSGRVAAVQNSVVAGFVREGRFLTRDEVAVELAQHGREVLYA